ncbi:hypothetical protein D3C71_843620 [compost metagenome]
MGNPAAELPDGLHFLRLKQRLAGLLKGLLRLGRLGDIPGDLGEAEQCTGLAPDRVHHDMGKKARAVLAQTPALVLETPVAHRNLQRALRFAGSTIFRGVEHGKMLADDFFRPVALDALRPGIPVGQASIRSEHVDGVIRDALHQQAKLLFALLECFFGHFTVGQIAGDLGKTEQSTRRVAYWVDHHVAPEARAVLAHPPALSFETSFANRRVQRPLGQTGTAIVFGVELREMMTENFGFFITLETPGASVPAADDARGINHVDRIVDHRIDQQTKARFIIHVRPGSIHAH